jgi:hypothetical protein
MKIDNTRLALPLEAICVCFRWTAGDGKGVTLCSARVKVLPET